ncbi:hypothetical protein VB713_12435 [Anabaena cylindrica UHCC 0172]|uniref:hypothetical protein n=1 Tax=Anabaena cylindrica TaxID=1165 RepID=UPI002B1EE0F9|nr:hypothetical protein [Anabaena cylindrica]MEA5551780.1 hypothetical protein [Anabaena cylindrica UHCC 0172]
MAKPKTQPETIEVETITISELCDRFGVSEETLRLAIAPIYPNDFDTLKAVPKIDIDLICAKLPQSLLTGTEPEQSPEHGTQAEQRTEQPGTLTTSQPQGLNGTSGTAGTPASNPTITDLITRQIGEEVQLIDALGQVRNHLVVNSIKASNSELVEQLNQNWMGTKAQYLGTLNGLVELAKEITPYTPDSTDLEAEIDAAMGALGKKLQS